MSAAPDDRPQSYGVASTVITPLCRVSTAVVTLSHNYGYYSQLETFIFSDDDRQKTRQFIHCTFSAGRDIPIREIERANRAHNMIAGVLRRKLTATTERTR